MGVHILHGSCLLQTVRHYVETTDKVLSSVRIAILTDFHDSSYGKNEKTLIETIQKQNPDLILLAEDIADDERSHNATKQLLSVIGSEYPCTGNHEYWPMKSMQSKISSAPMA
ncbi:hypothetical protein OBV_38240 [Oscillibacter valericigenes Sjm18-20]|nr:hypothetical protein OBV_38240 [Oscillibacter valericigenes Sjm18-20]